MHSHSVVKNTIYLAITCCDESCDLSDDDAGVQDCGHALLMCCVDRGGCVEDRSHPAAFCGD